MGSVSPKIVDIDDIPNSFKSCPGSMSKEDFTKSLRVDNFTMQKSHDKAIGSVLIFRKLGKIVTCGRDNCIKVWDENITKCEKSISADCVVQLMIWDEKKGIFFSCTDDGNVLKYELNDLDREKDEVVLDREAECFCNLLKVDSGSKSDSFFLCFSQNGNIYSVYPSQEYNYKIIKNSGITFTQSVSPALSRNKKHLFYVFCEISKSDNNDEMIQVINAKKGKKLLKIQTNEATLNGTSALTVYINSDEEEILIFSSRYMDGLFFVNIDKNLGEKNNKFVKKPDHVKIKGCFISLLQIDDAFVCLGDDCGGLHLYDIESKQELVDKNIDEGKENAEVNILELLPHKLGEIKLIAVVGDLKCKVISFSPKLQSEEEEKEKDFEK